MLSSENMDPYRRSCLSRITAISNANIVLRWGMQARCRSLTGILKKNWNILIGWEAGLSILREGTYSLASDSGSFSGPAMPERGVDGLTDQTGTPVLNLNDLIRLARKSDFSCTVTTNAQMDFSWVNADLIWMSLDGYREYHDMIRGKGTFEKLDKNAGIFAAKQAEKKAAGRKACVLGCNMAVNNLNKDSVADVVEYVKNSRFIESIAINFHTPYPGTEHLMPDDQTRAEIIDRIIALKKQHYPIQNSISGLKMMKVRGFKKNCWVSNFIITDGTRLRPVREKLLGSVMTAGFAWQERCIV